MKLTKAIVASLSLPAIVVPVTTLTSCSQGWGNATPFAIGGLDNGPYSYFGGNYYDIDGKNMLDYLQTSYSVQTGGGFYAYSAPMKFDNIDDEQKGIWKLGESGWYTSADGALSSSAKDVYKDPEGKTKTEYSTNAQNAALASNTDFVATIGNTINSYLDLALQYQASQLNENDNIELKDVSVAWGTGYTDLELSFDHGTKDDSYQNNQFIEMCLALSNLVGTGIVSSLFKTSQINFHFHNFPLPSYTNVTGKDDHKISGSFYNLIEGEDAESCVGGQYWQERSDVKKEEIEGQDPFLYKQYTYKNVPVIVHFDSIVKSYVNPRIKNKFLVNDVYSTDEQILDGIGSQWKDIFPKFADVELQQGAKPLYQSFTLDSTNTGIELEVPEEKYDTRIDWANLHGNDFIALVDYAVNAYDQDGTDIPEGHPERNKAIIAGVSNFFPAYFFDLYNDMFKELKHGDATAYVIDTKAVNRHNNDLLNLLNRTSKDGKKAHASDVSEDGKKLLSFLGYIFSNDDMEVDTENFIFPSEHKIR